MWGFYLNQIRRENFHGKLAEVVCMFLRQAMRAHMRKDFRRRCGRLWTILRKLGRVTKRSTSCLELSRLPTLRYLKSVFADFGLEAIVLPDYSDTLDGPAWSEYQQIPRGGTPLESIRRMGSAKATIEFGETCESSKTAGALLEERFGVLRHRLPMPIGVVQSDRLFTLLEQISGRKTPEWHNAERGRLVDAYVDAHKYVFGIRAVVYGEQDLVVGLASLLAEIGIVPILCASGSESGRLAEHIAKATPNLSADISILEGVDFAEIEEEAEKLSPDVVIGNSKGYHLSKNLGIPLVRVGLPIHDRIDGPRVLHLGYLGAQQLFDRIANTLIERSQDSSAVGYSYM